MTNQHIFEDLKIFNLPTLDDRYLIDNIILKANKGEKPCVDRLIYNYLDIDLFIDHLIDYIYLKNDFDIRTLYLVKNLYEEVIKRVPSNTIAKGKVIDRTCLYDGLYLFEKNFLKEIRNYNKKN